MRRIVGALRQGVAPEPSDLLTADGRRQRFRWQRVDIETLTTAADGTIRALVRHEDAVAETVVIPRRASTTLCVSSQWGCQRGCRFCATADLRPAQNLPAETIVAQLFAALAIVRERALAPIRNLVFMGMGEPLDNLDAVARAAEVMCSDGLYNLAWRRTTLSTVGPSPTAIARLAQWPGRVAWSLHAADAALRKALIRSARHHPTELRDAFADALGPRRRPLFLELTLIAGANDRPEDADAVLALMDRFPCEVRCNLIPCNPVFGKAHRPSSAEAVAAFASRLRAGGLRTFVRPTQGAEGGAACGQLAGRRTLLVSG